MSTTTIYFIGKIIVPIVIIFFAILWIKTRSGKKMDRKKRKTEEGINSSEVREGEIFTLAGEKYVITEKRLAPAGTNAGDLELVRFDKMWYYLIGENRYVLYDSRLYPCFDFDDRMYENRHYRVFYLCRSMQEMKNKYDYLQSEKLFFAGLNPDEKHRPQLSPYVYIDEGKEMHQVYE